MLRAAFSMYVKIHGSRVEQHLGSQGKMVVLGDLMAIEWDLMKFGSSGIPSRDQLPLLTGHYRGLVSKL